MKIDLKPLFANVNGNTIISIDTATTPVLKGGKSNPHQGRVTKLMVGANVMVFSNKKTHGYEAMVQRRLLKEGKNPASFTLGERPWGVRVPNLPIVEHEGNQYLEVIFLKSGTVQYMLDGKPVKKEDIQGLEEKKEGEQGGLEDKVIIRTFKAENLYRIVIDGVEVAEKGVGSNV